MGMIRDDFGNISVEQRRESFYIVPSYGWAHVYPQVRLSEIRVGECFRYSLPGEADDEPWQVTGQLIGKTLVKPATRPQSGDGDRVDSKRMVHPVDEHYAPDSTEVEVDTPFARHWRDCPAPEFLNEDLDDLIASLEDLRQALAS
jgi:hypothetical protein